jgi:hypothetical protein
MYLKKILHFVQDDRGEGFRMTEEKSSRCQGNVRHDRNIFRYQNI